MSTTANRSSPGLRFLAALSIAIAAGGGVMAAVNYVVYLGDFGGFWGLFFGSFAGMTALGISLALLSAGRGIMGRVIATVALGLFAILVFWWIAAWGIPILTLEGLWIWPLGIAPVVIALLVVMWPGRRTR